MTEPIQAAVFDLDGLMFDTEALFFRVAAEVLASRGKVFTPEIMRAMIGRRTADAGQAIVSLSGLDEPAEVILAEIRRRFDAQLDTAVHPTPGLFVLLDRLGRRGTPLAVATSSGRAYAENLLKRHQLLDRFGFLLTAEDVVRGKPDPEIYRKAAARFGIPPARMMVLEDSPAGVAAARGAGAFVVGVPHDHSPPDGLRAADLVISRLDAPALLACLDAPPRRDRPDPPNSLDRHALPPRSRAGLVNDPQAASQDPHPQAFEAAP
jgi:HAD superfamily hydrolase (TIGR01509 family)